MGPMTGDFSQSLDVGTLGLPNRVVLAPMSGDHRRPVPAACRTSRRRPGRLRDDREPQLAEGRRDAALRRRRRGRRLHVVQLAGCEPHWMAEGARIAEAAGADIIDINMGCPAKHVTGGSPAPL